MNSSDGSVLEGLETEAHDAKNGLWADPQPVPPWEWHRLRK
jgi:micrococcal nuclease